MAKAYTYKDLINDIISINRSLSKHSTRFVLSDKGRTRRNIVLKAKYSRGKATKTKSICEGYSARETKMIALAFKDGFNFYANKSK